MVIAVTISWELRKIVSARSTVTAVSMAAPVWSMPRDALGQPRIERVGLDEVGVVGHGLM